MQGRIHFFIFILISLLGVFISFKNDDSLSESIKEIKNLPNSTNNAKVTRTAFAKIYFEQILNKKIKVLNNKYFTLVNNKVHFIELGYNNKYQNILIDIKEKRPMLNLFRLQENDEIIPLNYQIETNDNYSIYSSNINIEFQLNQDKYLIPFDLFENEFLTTKKTEPQILNETFPQVITHCEEIFSKGTSNVDQNQIYPKDPMSIKNEVYKNHTLLKESHRYLKNIGPLNTNSDNLLCFDTNIATEEELISLLINYQFIFKTWFK